MCPRWRRAGLRRSVAFVEVNAGVPVQVAFPGGYRLKVTLPVGVTPPLTVAVSEMDVPTGPPAGVAVVAMVAADRLLMKLHAIGSSAAPVKVAAVPATVVVTLVPPTEHSAPTKVYPALPGVSVTVTVGVVPASTVTAADPTPLTLLTSAVVAVGATVPLEIAFVNVHPSASAGVGVISVPLGFSICLVIVSWLLQAPVASVLRTVPKSEFELLK